MDKVLLPYFHHMFLLYCRCTAGRI